MDTETSSASTAEVDQAKTIHQLQSQVEQLQIALQEAKSESEEYKRKLELERFGLQRFSTDDASIRFYTGFVNYVCLISFMKLVKPSASNMKSAYYISSDTLSMAGRPRTMLLEDELFMFLCRLRLGLFEDDLAVRFNCSISTVSRKIITWVNFLYFVLSSWQFWIPRETIQKKLPQIFRDKYPSTRVIIDCTEFKIQIPSSLVLNSQTFSSYKSANTFKCLIGIAPNGTVTFVSDLFTGSISDVEITRQCGILDLLEPGDSVMADKGFTIKKDLTQRGVMLNLPPFLGSSGQFTPSEVLETQSVAKARIHVERAIERIKRNSIFSSPFPLAQAGSINSLWLVSCLLTNYYGALINE